MSPPPARSRAVRRAAQGADQSILSSLSLGSGSQSSRSDPSPESTLHRQSSTVTANTVRLGPVVPMDVAGGQDALEDAAYHFRVVQVRDEAGRLAAGRQ